MKTRLASLIVTFLAAFTFSSFAQQGPGANGLPPEMNPEQRLKEMKDHLNLTPAQVSKIKAVFEADRPSVQAIRQNPSLTPQQKTAQLQDIRKNSRAQISGILTMSQKLKWMEYQKSKGSN